LTSQIEVGICKRSERPAQKILCLARALKKAATFCSEVFSRNEYGLSIEKLSLNPAADPSHSAICEVTGLTGVGEVGSAANEIDPVEGVMRDSPTEM
jgi:hypothetical protein